MENHTGTQLQEIRRPHVEVARRDGQDSGLLVLCASGERWGWEGPRDRSRLARTFPDPYPAAPTIQAGPPAGTMEAQREAQAARKAAAVASLLGGMAGRRLGKRRLAAAEQAEQRAQAIYAATGSRHAQLQAHYIHLAETWTNRKSLWDAEERERVSRLAEWGAARPVTQPQRVAVYGGTPAGWAALLTTLGVSLVASGSSLDILDCSEAEVPAGLCKLLEELGRAPEIVIFPQDAASFPIFEDLDANAVVDMLVEALHGGASQPDRSSRALDARVLSGITSTLAPTITIKRIVEALALLMRYDEYEAGVQMGREIGLAPSLNAAERSSLGVLFSPEQRDRLTERFLTLESQLEALGDIGSAPAPTLRTGRSTCISTSAENHALQNELFVDILVQRIIRRLRRFSPASHTDRVLIVVAADQLPTRHLEKLDQLAETRGVRLVFLCRHYRGPTSEVAGGNGSAAAFMRLGNDQEAEHAATFIGREYRLKLSHETTNWGITDTTSWSDTSTETTGQAWANSSSSKARQEGGASAPQRGGGETKQRVHEYAIEPDVLRSLPETAVLMVEFGSGERIVQAFDCSPMVASLPNVATMPFAEADQRAAPTLGAGT